MPGTRPACAIIRMTGGPRATTGEAILAHSRHSLRAKKNLYHFVTSFDSTHGVQIMAKSKQVRIGNQAIADAHRYAESARGRPVSGDREAIETCIAGLSDANMTALKVAIESRTRAIMAANTLAVCRHLTGEDLELRHYETTGEWWIVRPGASQGFALGKVPSTEMSKALAAAGLELADPTSH